MRHALAEARSLAYHRVVAERLRAEPETLAAVRDKLRARVDAGGASEYACSWLSLLEGDREQLVEVMQADTEAARALRQASPFANLMPPRARWALWAAVRREHERAP